MKYATRDKTRGNLYKGKTDEKTGLEILAQGDRVTIDTSRDAIKKWCENKKFNITRELHDQRTDRTIFLTDASRLFIHDGKRNMLLSD